jgi:hypothetical protein
LCFTKSIAQSNLPTDPNGEVVFKKTFKLNSALADEDVYALMQNWITQGTDKFTRQNTDIPEGKQSKSKFAVDQAFDNSKPLQSLDPYANRIALRGLIKYYGGPTALINLLYIEYYMIAEISDHQLTITINKLKYHHFNAQTYAARNIYHWEGGQPCAVADQIESLVAKQEHIPEMNDLSEFVNKDMRHLFADLKQQLKVNNALPDTKDAVALKASAQ